jgi:signal transduction histidine kinase
MVEHEGPADDRKTPILLVDDWPANLLALEVLLASAAYDLVSVRSGPEALAQVAQRDFAVILLDLQMPGMDGVETALRMKELAIEPRRTGPSPIIFVTGADAAPPRVLKAYASGAVDFIQKPLDADVVRAKVAVFADLYRAKQRLVIEMEERVRLQNALRAREDLLAVVAHDLRSPLGAVLMGARLIDRFAEGSEPAARIKKASAGVVRAVDRMSRLVEDLLDLARLGAGQTLPVNLERTDLAPLAAETVEMLEPVANAKGLLLENEIVGATLAQCDRERVEQILSNLIGNAIKFTGAGGSIRIGARETDHEIVVSVRETGIGIPEEHLARIFEPYWQVDAQRKRGTGLGLFIVKAIVLAHGGRVGVETAARRGSSFWFSLPRAVEA